MKKQTKYILITLAIAIVLGGVLAALYFTDPARQESSQESSASSAADTTLLTKDESELKSIKVKNTKSEFTILTEKNSQDEVTYTIKDYEKFNLKTATLESAAGMFLSLSYTKEIGEVDDLDSYGLNGDVQATATYSDGSEVTIVIGATPGETTGNYILFDGKVYIATINTLYSNPIEEQISTISWTIDQYTDDSGNSFSYLNSIDLKGTNFDREIEMVYDDSESDYLLKKPVEAGGSVTLAESLATTLLTFSTDSVVAVNPTDAKLTEMGFDTPYCDMSFTLNGISHQITLGNKSDTSRYCYVDGDKTVIYLVANDTTSAWADTNEVKFRDGYILIKMITSVNKLNIDADGKSIQVDFERTKNEDSSTDTQTVYDYTAKLNGKEIEYKTVTSFYKNVIGIPMVNMQELEKTGDPVITISYNHYDGSPETKLEFYKSKDKDNRYVCYIDGEYSATVRDTSINDFLESFNDFVAANS